MKKLLLSISFIVCFFAGFSQSIVQRSTGANTLVDPNLFTSKSFRPPVFADTAAANAQTPTTLDSCGKIIFTYNVMALWTRACSPKRWERVGGSISFENSSSITFSGTGASTTPIVANVNVSAQQGNAITVNGDGIFVKDFIQDGIKQPGFITWISNYDYDVSPAIGVIGGVPYTSDWTPITLANADPTFNRFDLVVFNQGGSITVITGTPSDDPQLPTVNDPSTQLAMAHIEVTANTTQPPIPPTQDWVYENYITNAWNTLSSSVRINDQSTSNSYSVPTNVQFTAAQNGDNIRFTSVMPPTIANFNVVTLKIRSLSIWANDSRIGLQWYSGATPIGAEVPLTNGTYGFTSTNLTLYQIVTIPLNDFGLLTNPTNLLITVRTTAGRTISFHIDDIQLQQGIIPVTGNFWAQGGNSFGTTGILGTRDIQDIRIISSDTVRGTIKSDGKFMWGTTTNSGHFFQIGGNVAIKNSTNISTLTANANGRLNVSSNNASFITDLYLQSTGTSSTAISRFIFNNATGNAGQISFIGSGAASPNIYKSSILIENKSDIARYFKLSSLDPTGLSTYEAMVVDYNTYNLPLTTLNGDLKFGTYLPGTHTGVVSNFLAVDADGDVILTTGGGGISAITADNGLTANTSTNVQLGGALLGNTTISTSTFKLRLEGPTAFADSANLVIKNTNSPGTGRGIFVHSASSLAGYFEGFSGVQAVATNGQGLTASATGTGFAISATAITSRVADFNMNPSSTNDVANILNLVRSSSGTAANGIGGSVSFVLEAITSQDTSTMFISKWTDATFATRTSEFSITGVNSASNNATIFTLAGTGALRLNSYGIGTFTGTPAYTLQVDASGNIIEGTLSGGTYTASNGLTMTANNTKLGGSLIEATTVATGAFSLTVSTSTSGVTPLNVSSNNAAAVVGTSTSNYGIWGVSTTGIGGVFNINPASTNTIAEAARLYRTTSGTAANGIGVYQGFYAQTISGTTSEVGRVGAAWTDATTATRTGDLQFWTTNSGTSAIKATLAGNGAWRYYSYGTGAITGTAAFGAAWDASGNLIEIALGGGGGGTVNSVAGTLNRITSTGGTDPIIDISASYVGQASITTLGTITTGVWNGTAIGDTYISSATTWNAKQTGDATLTALAGLTITNGSIIYGTGADAFAVLAAGTNGQVLSLSGGVPVWSSVGAGTMTTITGVTANGFAWSIANPTTTPALTLSVSITGMLKGNGTAISAAVAGTDYLTPTGSAALLTSFPTFNQNTTGSAATLTTSRNINGVAFNGSADITITSAAGTLSGTTLNATVVSSSLTSVGTITTGTWQGTAIGLGFGGTGLTSGGTANQLLGMNSAGNASQYKTFSSSNGITITHSVGGVAIANTFNPTPQTLADGATITWNVASGGNAKVTLAGTGRTLSIPAPVAGYTYTIEITQGSGGSKTITTWPTGTTWSGSNTLSTTAGDVDVVVFYYSGTGYRAVMTTDYD